MTGKWAVAIDLNYQHGVNSGCTWAQKPPEKGKKMNDRNVEI